MKRITLLIADDHKIVREALRLIVEREPDLEVVGEAQNGREAVAMATTLRPDVVLMDLAMPHLNGLDATRQIGKLLPATKVLLLSAHEDDAFVESVSECGAVGLLRKQASSMHEVCDAIREIGRGKTFFSATRVKTIEKFPAPDSHHNESSVKKLDKLTSREREVLQLIAESRANKQTAAELGIAIKTVEKHRGKLAKKLDIHDTAGLTRFAISAGIIECAPCQ